MKNLNRIGVLMLFIIMSSIEIGCQRYLDVKPSSSLVVPDKPEELQALLDYNSTMNTMYTFEEASSDNYYLMFDDWSSLIEEARNTYTWQGNIYEDGANGFRLSPYQQLYHIIYYANVALDAFNEVKESKDAQLDIAAWDNVRGSALFFRALALQKLVAQFAPAYDSSKASSELGVPLRLNSNFNLKSVRASLKDCYAQILSDLEAAVLLLPNIPQHVMRPSKAAAFALLARIYLYIGQYAKSAAYADSSLIIKSDLMNYNEFDSNSAYPFEMFNKEVIFNSTGYSRLTASNYAKIDTMLLATYKESDLRKSLYFKANSDGSVYFSGSYSNSSLFNGIATDEVFLTKAESLARIGQVELAMKTLNQLMINRWVSGKFIPFTASSADQALQMILNERRKELLMRDLRWMDIKRLNAEGQEIVQARKLNDQTITLAPNDRRYALPFPEDIISLTGMPQN